MAQAALKHQSKIVSEAGLLRTSHFLIPAVLILTAGILLAQFVIPFGWALNGFYLLPVSLAAFCTSYRQTFLVIWIATLCTVLGTMVFFGSPFWDNKATLAMAFLLPIGSLWLISLLSIVRKWQERKAKSRNKRQTLCPMCQRINNEDTVLSIRQYGLERPGSFVYLRTCNECRERDG